jgi:hypothetical protein
LTQATKRFSIALHDSRDEAAISPPVNRGLRIRPRPIRLIRTVEDEARHLEEIAESGESPETPVIVIGLVVLALIPVVALVLGGALAAYYLAT